MADQLTADELAARCGISRERVWDLVGLGVLKPRDGSFERRDVMRARVVTHLEEMGLEVEALAKAVASGHLTLGYLESAGRRHPRSDDTFAQLSEQLGIPFRALERAYLAFGLPRPERDERVREEDLDAIQTEWESLDHIRAFAGDDVERAVVSDEAKAMLTRFDGGVRHYHVALDRR